MLPRQNARLARLSAALPHARAILHGDKILEDGAIIMGSLSRRLVTAARGSPTNATPHG
jgi:hypothetical protein